MIDNQSRKSYNTGAVRESDELRGNPSLLPTEGLRRAAVHMQRGSEKYSRHNWRKGLPLSRYIDAMQRHLWSVIENQTDEDHEAAIICNILMFIETKKLISQKKLPDNLDDVSETKITN